MQQMQRGSSQAASPRACTQHSKGVSWRKRPAALLHEPSAQSCKFGVANRPSLFQPTELFNFICDAETNCAPEFVSCLLSSLHVTLRHASSLKDQVCKHENKWKYYPSYHPYCLDP